MKIKVKLLHPDAKVPKKQYKLDAGFDLFSIDEVKISYNELTIVDCGFAIDIPPGYEAQIRPRSGLAFKHGITVINSPGTIDSGFLGSVKIALTMLIPNERLILPKGSRIAQMVINKLPEIEVEKSDILNNTERGTKAFGSSGL
jgi:dUTP pyrophosphatase